MAGHAMKEKGAKLTTLYKTYVIFECLLINLVGFLTLFFQCELQRLAQWIENQMSSFPPQQPRWLSTTAIEALTGHFWLVGDKNCASPEAHCLTYMIAGWLMIAGVLQALINLDGFRTTLLWLGGGGEDPPRVLPRSIKLGCLYAFGACDFYWIVLMIVYRDIIGWQQIVGSAFDIVLRLPFALNHSLMFQFEQEEEEDTLDPPLLNVITSSNGPRAAAM